MKLKRSCFSHHAVALDWNYVTYTLSTGRGLSVLATDHVYINSNNKSVVSLAEKLHMLTIYHFQTTLTFSAIKTYRRRQERNTN